MTAAAISAADPDYNGILRTACIRTLLSAAHTKYALPQSAGAFTLHNLITEKFRLSSPSNPYLPTPSRRRALTPVLS